MWDRPDDQVIDLARALLEAARERLPASSDYTFSQTLDLLTITIDRHPGPERVVYTYDDEEGHLIERYRGPRSMQETCRIFDQMEGMRCPNTPVVAGLCGPHVTETLEQIAHEIRPVVDP